MQPAFLPWTGFFNLIEQVDDFIFLDNVQLEKQSWQTRNRLLFANQVHWISVPVGHKNLAQTIAETEIVGIDRWRKKLARGFQQNYGRHPHYAAARELIDVLCKVSKTHLADMNAELIHFVADKLDLNPRFHKASEIDAGGVRSERLIALCRHVQADEYVSPVGSADYLVEDRFAEKSSINLSFQDYRPGPYIQQGAVEFTSHLSVLDAVANLGWELTRRYVLKGSV